MEARKRGVISNKNCKLDSCLIYHILQQMVRRPKQRKLFLSTVYDLSSPYNKNQYIVGGVIFTNLNPGEKKNSNDYKNYPKSTMHSYG